MDLMSEIIGYIIISSVISFLIGAFVDYVLFRIWHYLAHREQDRYRRSSKSYSWDRKAKKREIQIKTSKEIPERVSLKKDEIKELKKRGFKINE